MTLGIQIKNHIKRSAFLLLLLVLFCFGSGFTGRPLPTRPTLPHLFDRVNPPQSLFNPEDLLLRPDDSLTTTLPFNKAGNLILIKGKVDNVEGNFILDTGAPHLVLNMVYFRDYPITVVSSESHTSVTGTADLIQRTQVRSFNIGDMAYIKQEADLVDLGHIENSKGLKILGLIGFDLLQNCELVIDFAESVIHLHRIGRKEGARYNSPHLGADTTYATLPLELRDKQIIMQAEMAGRKLRFVLDSGAETNILDSRLPESIFEQVNIIGRMSIRGTGQKMIEALRGDANQVRIGNDTVDRLPVLITNLAYTCFAQNMGVNGVLGLEFMQLRKIGFNFVTRKMYLWK